MVVLRCEQPKQLVRGAKQSTSIGRLAVHVARKPMRQSAGCLQRAQAQKEMYGVLTEARPKLDSKEGLDTTKQDVPLQGYEPMVNVSAKTSREEAIMFQGTVVLLVTQASSCIFASVPNSAQAHMNAAIPTLCSRFDSLWLRSIRLGVLEAAQLVRRCHEQGAPAGSSRRVASVAATTQ
jgi:hypothetical protein